MLEGLFYSVALTSEGYSRCHFVSSVDREHWSLQTYIADFIKIGIWYMAPQHTLAASVVVGVMFFWGKKCCTNWGTRNRKGDSSVWKRLALQWLQAWASGAYGRLRTEATKNGGGRDRSHGPVRVILCHSTASRLYQRAKRL